jgi:hypothetical protein
MKMNLWKNLTDRHPTQVGENQLGRLLKDRKVGQPLRYGHLGMIPLFGSECTKAQYALPETALSLTKVTNYGQMILKNSSNRPAIVPLNLGYFQLGAQNHAMCTSWVLGAGEEREFKDACCIQESQGGYIKESDDRFIVLPHSLRKAALALKGKEEYGKLWQSITTFNTQLGLKARGHLDEMKQAFQPELLQTVYHLEPQPEQTGAIFLLNDEVVGIELAPDAAFWAELHTPLVMYCYAPLRLAEAHAQRPATKGEALNIEGLTSFEMLKGRYEALQQKRVKTAETMLQDLGEVTYSSTKEQESKASRLFTIRAGAFAGQMVMNGNQLAYASLFNEKVAMVS